jgi:hypothetical protein
MADPNTIVKWNCFNQIQIYDQNRRTFKNLGHFASFAHANLDAQKLRYPPPSPREEDPLKAKLSKKRTELSAAKSGSLEHAHRVLAN